MNLSKFVETFTLGVRCLRPKPYRMVGEYVDILRWEHEGCKLCPLAFVAEMLFPGYRDNQQYKDKLRAAWLLNMPRADWLTIVETADGLRFTGTRFDPALRETMESLQ